MLEDGFIVKVCWKWTMALRSMLPCRGSLPECVWRWLLWPVHTDYSMCNWGWVVTWVQSDQPSSTHTPTEPFPDSPATARALSRSANRRAWERSNVGLGRMSRSCFMVIEGDVHNVEDLGQSQHSVYVAKDSWWLWQYGEFGNMVVQSVEICKYEGLSKINHFLLVYCIVGPYDSVALSPLQLFIICVIILAIMLAMVSMWICHDMFVLFLPEHRGARERDAERPEAPGAGHVYRGVPYPPAERPGGQVSTHRLPLSLAFSSLCSSFHKDRGMLFSFLPLTSPFSDFVSQYWVMCEHIPLTLWGFIIWKLFLLESFLSFFYNFIFVNNYVNESLRMEVLLRRLVTTTKWVYSPHATGTWSLLLSLWDTVTRCL